MLRMFPHSGWCILLSGLRGRSSPRHGFRVTFCSSAICSGVRSPTLLSGTLRCKTIRAWSVVKKNLRLQSLNRVLVVGFKDDFLVGVSGCRHDHCRHDQQQSAGQFSSRTTTTATTATSDQPGTGRRDIITTSFWVRCFIDVQDF